MQPIAKVVQQQSSDSRRVYDLFCHQKQSCIRLESIARGVPAVM